jgi:hypothetical protein
MLHHVEMVGTFPVDVVHHLPTVVLVLPHNFDFVVDKIDYDYDYEDEDEDEDENEDEDYSMAY